LTKHNEGIGRIATTAQYTAVTADLVIFIRVAVNQMDNIERCVTDAEDYCHAGRLRPFTVLSTMEHERKTRQGTEFLYVLA
jgi:hypothetical protein